MSHSANTRYLEGANELFEECIDSADHAGAKIIIEQLHRDGFSTEAYDLENQLLNTPIGKFTPAHSIDELLAHLEGKTGVSQRNYPRNKDGLKRVDNGTWIK